MVFIVEALVQEQPQVYIPRRAEGYVIDQKIEPTANKVGSLFTTIW